MSVKSGNRVAWFIALAIGGVVAILVAITDCNERAEKAARSTKPGGEIPPKLIAKGRSAIARARGEPEVPVRDVVVESETVQNGPPVLAPDQPKAEPEVAHDYKEFDKIEDSAGVPHVFAFSVNRALSFEQQIEAGAKDAVFLNPNFQDKDVIKSWKDKEAQRGQSVETEKLDAVLLKIGDHPVTEWILMEMDRLGYRPATPRELFAFSTQWRSKKFRVNSVGDGSVDIGNKPHFAHIYYQPDKNWYGAAGFAFSLKDTEVGAGWSYDKRERPDDPAAEDYFLAIKK